MQRIDLQRFLHFSPQTRRTLVELDSLQVLR